MRVILDGPVAKNGGVLLYAVFIYALAAAFALRMRPVNVAWVTLAVCWAVEAFQSTGVPHKWAEYTALSRLALGTTFLWQDLPWYAVGTAAAMCLHHVMPRWLATAGGAAIRRHLTRRRGKRPSTLIAVLTVLVLTGPGSWSVIRAYQAQQLEKWAQTIAAVGDLATSLQTERREAVATVRGDKDTDYERHRIPSTDQARETYTPARNEAAGLLPHAESLTQRIDLQIAGLPELRAQVLAGEATRSPTLVADLMDTYDALIADLLLLHGDRVATRRAPAAVAAKMRATAALSRAAEAAARQQVTVSWAAEVGPATPAVAARTIQARDDLAAAIQDTTAAAPQWRDRIDRAMSHEWVANAAQLERDIVAVAPGAPIIIDRGLWHAYSMRRARELRAVERAVQADIAMAVHALAEQRWAWVWGTAATITAAAPVIALIAGLRRVLRLNRHSCEENMTPATHTYADDHNDDITRDVPADVDLHRHRRPGTQPAKRTPAVARWLPRPALITARDAIPMTQKDAADAVGWSMSTLQHIETGQITISEQDLRNPLRLYHVKHNTGWLNQLANTARKPLKPWHNPTLRDHDPFRHAIIQIEHDAHRIRRSESGSIPNPLQIGPYAAALHSLMTTEFPPQICAVHTAAYRLQRQLFLRSPGRRPTYQVILDEAVICRPHGGLIVLQDQLEALPDNIRSRDLELAIAAYESGIPSTVDTPFILMELHQCDHTVRAPPCGVSGPTITAETGDDEFHLHLRQRLWAAHDPAFTELTLLRHPQRPTAGLVSAVIALSPYAAKPVACQPIHYRIR